MTIKTSTKEKTFELRVDKETRTFGPHRFKTYGLEETCECDLITMPGGIIKGPIGIRVNGPCPQNRISEPGSTSISDKDFVVLSRIQKGDRAINLLGVIQRSIKQLASIHRDRRDFFNNFTKIANDLRAKIRAVLKGY